MLDASSAIYKHSMVAAVDERPVEGLRALDRARPVYKVPRDDLALEVMVPALTAATNVRCMVGYFDSSAFRTLAPGLAAFITNSSAPLRFLASPILPSEDQQAIREALADPEAVAARVVSEVFEGARLSTDSLINHHYRCLAYLLAKGRLEFAVVLMRERGIFHPKVWEFQDGRDTVVLHGSSNVTTPGLLYNYETVRLERPWRSTDAEQTVAEFKELMDQLWARQDPDALVVDLPQAVRLQMLQHDQGLPPPTMADFWAAWREAQPAQGAGTPEPTGASSSIAIDSTAARLTIPPGLNWDNGPFAHQGAAVRAWEAADGRGILAMATGAGKTITALICATRQQDRHTPLLLVIAAPYLPLVEQWEDEVRAFGIEPLPLRAQSSAGRTQVLRDAVRELEFGHAAVHVAVVTVAYLNDRRFREMLQGVPARITTMFVGDEVHNLGAEGFIGAPPERFDLRLGLSATPERQYDATGTAALFSYFGGDAPLYEFGLRQAIVAGALVPYTYHLHPVQLNDDEFEQYERLTDELRRAGFHGGDDEESINDRVQRLLIRRRAVLETASGKLEILRRLLTAEGRRAVHHTLIYATDKNPEQLESVNRLLIEEDLLFHQLTSEETSSPSLMRGILARFASGDLQVVTCKRVLDEGVNIPQVTTAYLLASSAVRRQWVQRRGRILRRCSEVGKEIARLHDFVVEPPDPASPAGRSILKGERARARAFAEAANNAGGEDDPFAVLAALGAS